MLLKNFHYFICTLKNRYTFAPVFRKLARLFLSFTLILSIGYSQLFLVYSLGAFSLNSVTENESVSKIASGVFHLSPILKSDPSSDRQVMGLESIALEKDPDEYMGLISLEFQLALASVFFFLLSVSLLAYHTRFLRFYRNFSYIHPHRIHLYNSVFTI